MKHLLALLDDGTLGTPAEPTTVPSDGSTTPMQSQWVKDAGTLGTLGTLLGRQGSASPAPTLPDPSEIAERAAILIEAAGLDSKSADALALQAGRFDSFAALAAEHRRIILREVEALSADAMPTPGPSCCRHRATTAAACWGARAHFWIPGIGKPLWRWAGS